MGKIILGYWDIHGFGSQIRFLLEIVGAKYEDELYTIEEADKWFKEKKDNLDLLYPNLPYLIHDDVRMTEHLPILRYIARKHGLYPQTEQELLIAEQTESFLFDLRFRFVQLVYAPLEYYEKTVGDWSELNRKRLPYLNKVLGQNEYVAGNRLTYVDVVVYDYLLFMKAFEPSILKENPNLDAHLKKIHNLPQIQNYMNGKGIGVWKERTFCAPFANWKGKM